MNNLKNYENLFALYKKGRNSLNRSIIIFLVIFVVSIVSIFFDLGDAMFSFSMIALMMSLIVLLILGICSLVYSLTTKKTVRQFTEDELSRMNEDILNVPEYKGFYITRDALIYARANFTMLPLREIIWVYKQVTTNRVNGISTGKTYSAIIALKNKKSKFFATNKKDDLMDFLRQELTKYRNGIFFGYSDELHALFNMYIDRMIQLSEEAERQ